jgi:amidohydrolase
MNWMNEIENIAASLQDEIENISNFIFSHPELGDSEFVSSSFLAALLKQSGFRVEYPYCSLPTAFRAEFGSSHGPKIAFLAEYDALPGYGPRKEPAHACGHNWIAASTVGAALILSKLSAALPGTAVVIGTPAEETYGRKIDLVKSGAFGDIDAVFQMHLNESTNLHASALAMDSWRFEFLGRASHAASHPFYGINALDAVNLTFAGISALRQQLKPDVRIHGIITDGGEAVNIIPERAVCEFYVRAEKRSYLNEVSEKVKNCARGAALMTGAKLNIRSFENSYDDLQVNPVLSELMLQNLTKAGIDDFSEEPEFAGSTDIGNVSYCVPTFYGNIGVGGGTARAHEEAFLEHVNSSEAHAKLGKVAKAFAFSAYQLFTQPELLKQVKETFQNK